MVQETRRQSGWITSTWFCRCKLAGKKMKKLHQKRGMKQRRVVDVGTKACAKSLGVYQSRGMDMNVLYFATACSAALSLYVSYRMGYSRPSGCCGVKTTAARGR